MLETFDIIVENSLLTKIQTI